MIEIPQRMRSLPRDPRGYPIPFVVFREPDGSPHFTINDTGRVEFVRQQDRCPICGESLFRGRWFVGGPASAFHPRGAYLDPPMHHECAQYALQVCPYLAAPKYAKRIDAKTLDANKARTMVLNDPTVDNARPPFFVAVMAVGQTVEGTGQSIYIKPKRPYRAVEFWRHGREIGQAEAAPLLVQAFPHWADQGWIEAPA